MRDGADRSPSLRSKDRVQLNIFKINKEKYKFNKMSSKGIEPLTAINQFFYRESPLPIGSPALIYNYI